MRIKTKNEKIIDVLHERDLGDYKTAGARIRTYCPVHGGDHQKSLSIDRSTGWGHCFNASYNAIVLIREFNPEVAERLLQRHLPHSLDRSKRSGISSRRNPSLSQHPGVSCLRFSSWNHNN